MFLDRGELGPKVRSRPRHARTPVVLLWIDLVIVRAYRIESLAEVRGGNTGVQAVI